MTVAIVVTLFVRVNHELFVYVRRAFGIVFLGATYHVFTSSGQRPAARGEELPPGALRSDPKLLLSLVAVAFAGPALALALLIGTYLLARGR